MNEEEHYNDFESSSYRFKGEQDHFLFGFSTPGYNDIIANGGKEMLEEIYKPYYDPSFPSLPNCNITLAVDRSTIPKKISI